MRTEMKACNELVLGDDIQIGGMTCTVVKVEDVYHHVPKSRVRITLGILGSIKTKNKALLFLPYGTPVEVRQK